MAERAESTERSWERAWTTEEMRQNAGTWSLAGDAGLLRHLQEFSQTLISRTQQTTRSIDKLFERLDKVGTDIENSTNAFLSLSNTQFVENRVYDDDDKETPTEENKDKDGVEAKDKARDEEKMISSIREALHRGLEVMDTRYTVVQVPNSDSEDEEDNSNSTRTVLKVIDPYLHRPLPHLIGSEAFMRDPDIGLTRRDSAADSESEAEAEKSLNEGDSTDSDIDEKEASDSPSNSPPDQSGDMFGADSPPLVQASPRSQLPSFAEQLASKLGGVASRPVDQSEDMFSPVDQSDDLFSPEPDDSLFGKFSGGRGLFGDLEQAERNAKKEPSKPSEDAISSPTPKEADTSPMPSSKPAAAKPPADLFGGQDDSDDGLWGGAATSKKRDSIFTASRDEDDLFSSSKPQTKTQAPTVSDRDVKKPTGGVSIIGPGFFLTSDKLQDSRRLLSTGEADAKESSTASDKRLQVVDDGASLFTSTPEDAKMATSPSQLDIPANISGIYKSPLPSDEKSKSKSLSLFGDLDEEDDLFAVSTSRTSSSAASKSRGSSTRESPRVESSAEASGNVSAVAHGQQSSSSGNGSLDFLTSSVSGISPGLMKNNAQSSAVTHTPSFQYDQGNEEDSLLQPKPRASAASSSPRPTNQPPLSLFDDSEDDDHLFSSASSPGSNIQPLNKSLFDRSDNLFADEEYDIFAPKKNQDDLFAPKKRTADLFPAEKKDSLKPKAETELFAPQSDLFSSSKVEDDFLSPKPQSSSKSDLFASKGSSKNLFDTDDDLFAPVPSSKTPLSQDSFSVPSSKRPAENTEDLFGSSAPISSRLLEDLKAEQKPRKPEPPKSLNIRQPVDLFNWNDDADDDLFSLPPKSKPQPNVQKAEVKIPTQEKPTVASVKTEVPISSAASEKKPDENLFNVPSKPENAPVKEASKPEISKSKPVTKPAVIPRSTATTEAKQKEPSQVEQEVVKEKVVEKIAEVKSVASDVKPVPSDTKLIGKIKSPVGLVIDPRMLLPGGKPNKPTPDTPVGQPDGHKTVEVVKTPNDQEVVVSTLHSVAKDRAKIVAKRRPQSRKARHEAIRTSAIFPDEAPPLASSPAHPQADGIAKRLTFSATSTPPGTSPAPNLLSPSTDEEDLFGVPQDLYVEEQGSALFPEPKSGIFSKPFSPSANLFSDDESLFNPKRSTTQPSEAKDDLVPERSPSVPKSDPVIEKAKIIVEDTKEDELFGVKNKASVKSSNNDDLFGASSQKVAEKGLFGAVEVDKDDDLFGKPSKDVRGSKNDEDLFGSVKDVSSKNNMFETAKDTDLFGVRVKDVKSEDMFETAKDSDLFGVRVKDVQAEDMFGKPSIKKDKFDAMAAGDNDDLFSVKPKGSSVGKPDEDLFKVEERMEDIFSEGKPRKPAKVESMFDDADEDLFSVATKIPAATQSSEKAARRPAKTGGAKSLFGDDDDDDIFTSRPAAVSSSGGKPAAQKKPAATKPAKSSDTFQDPLMGGLGD